MVPIYFASVRRHNFGCGDQHGISCRRQTYTHSNTQAPTCQSTHTPQRGQPRRRTTTPTTHKRKRHLSAAPGRSPGNPYRRTHLARRRDSAPNPCVPQLHPEEVTAQQSCYTQIHRATHPTFQARRPNGSARAFRWPHRRRYSRTRSECDRRPPSAAPSGEPRQPQTHLPAAPPTASPPSPTQEYPPQARRGDAAASGAFNTVKMWAHGRKVPGGKGDKLNFWLKRRTMAAISE